MAITATVLTSATDAVDATSKTTASITTNAARLTLAWISNSKTSTPDLPTITDAGRTWVQVATVLYSTIASPSLRLTCFRCMAGATGTLTFDFGGVTQTGFVYSVEEYAGVDTGGTAGSAAVVQAVTDRSDSSNAFTVTLAAFGSVDHATVGAVAKNGTAAFTAGSGFTVLTDLAVTPPAARLQTQWRADNDTTVDWTWATALRCGGIALELATPAAGPQTISAPPVVMTWVVPTAVVLAGALSLAAPVASAAWVVPTAVVSGALTLAAPPATTTWTVPSASLVPGALAISAAPAITTWTVPVSLVTSSGLVTLDSLPAIVTWVVPTATVSNVAPNVTVQHVLRGSVERTVTARGSWTRTVTLRGRVG